MTEPFPQRGIDARVGICTEFSPFKSVEKNHNKINTCGWLWAEQRCLSHTSVHLTVELNAPGKIVTQCVQAYSRNCVNLLKFCQ